TKRSALGATEHLKVRRDDNLLHVHACRRPTSSTSATPIWRNGASSHGGGRSSEAVTHSRVGGPANLVATLGCFSYSRSSSDGLRLYLVNATNRRIGTDEFPVRAPHRNIPRAWDKKSAGIGFEAV